MKHSLLTHLPHKRWWCMCCVYTLFLLPLRGIMLWRLKMNVNYFYSYIYTVIVRCISLLVCLCCSGKWQWQWISFGVMTSCFFNVVLMSVNMALCGWHLVEFTSGIVPLGFVHVHTYVIDWIHSVFSFFVVFCSVIATLLWLHFFISFQTARVNVAWLWTRMNVKKK